MIEVDALTLSMLRSAVAISDRAAVVLIESQGRTCPDACGLRWYDISRLIDEREYCPSSIDMNTEELGWAFARGLIEQHPAHPLLVRITRFP